jgi:hypothetical protein
VPSASSWKKLLVVAPDPWPHYFALSKSASKLTVPVSVCIFMIRSKHPEQKIVINSSNIFKKEAQIVDKEFFIF